MEDFVKGMKEAHKVCGQFLDEKKKKGYPEYITREELNNFLTEYVRLWEKTSEKYKHPNY